MRKAWFWGTSIIIVALLFFQYPYMMSLQDEGQEFAVTTVRGDVPYMYDVNWFASDIISVSERPGLFIRDTITFEHRDEIIPLQGSIPFLMHAIIYKFTDNLTLTFILGAIISTIITIFLIFLISKKLHHLLHLKYSPLTSSFFALAFVTFPFVIANAARVLIFGDFFLRPYIGYIGRFININHIIIFLLIWFYLLLTYLYEKKPKPSSFIYLGLIMGILQYTYFYYWTSVLVFTATAFIIKKGITKENIINGSITYGTWAILAIPYIINYFRFHEFNQDFSLRAGMNDALFTNYTWLYLLLATLTIVVFIFSYLSCKARKADPFPLSIHESALPLALLITAIVTLNIQYVIGYTVQQNHWASSFINPLMLLMLFLIVLQKQKYISILAKKKKGFWTIPHKSFRPIIIAIILILSISTVIQAGTAAKQWKDYYSFDKQDQELLSFLKTNTQKDDVLFGDTTYTNDIIGVNTERRTLLGHPLHSRITTTETHDRLIFGYEALGMTKGDITEIIKKSDGYFTFRAMVKDFTLDHPYDNFNYFHHYYHFSFFNHTRNIYDSDALVAAIENHEQTGTYRLDFLVYTKGLYIAPSDGIVFENDRYIVVQR